VIFSKYPPETQFDLIGHSLGHVVSLVTFADLGYLPRVRKLIGLAGVMFGQWGKKPGLCSLKILENIFCGDIFDHLIGTDQPALITDLISSNQEAMNHIQKCSLFSPQDGMLNPFNSGAFPDGINVSLPRVKHLRFKSAPVVFSALSQHCYNGNINE